MVNTVADPDEIQPLAKICGEPLMEIPQDLYIPPDALEVFLDTFQGPLDLLLYLIRKHNLNILDIPMAELTRQYMAYVEIMRVDQLNLAAEYLLMTALLIEIKSRMLLPVDPGIEVEDTHDPRAELVRRLLEYEQMKKAAERLNDLPLAGRDFCVIQIWSDPETTALPSIDKNDLYVAWMAILTRAKLNRHHLIRREALSVRTYMSQILRDLRGCSLVEFYDLFSPMASVAEVVVTFLAVLELARELLLEVFQSEDTGIIHVRTIDVIQRG